MSAQTEQLLALGAELAETRRHLEAALQWRRAQSEQLAGLGSELARSRAWIEELTNQIGAIGAELVEARRVASLQQGQLEAVGLELARERALVADLMELEATTGAVDPAKFLSRGSVADENRYMAGPDSALPSILLNALPKSAGHYLSRMLMHGLGLPHSGISVGLFPGDVINYRLMPRFLKGGRVAHHHLDPSAINKWFLRVFGNRFVIHVRDPRASILSWVHHLKGATRPEELLPYPAVTPPAEYFTRDFAWRLDWMVENHLTIFIDWIAGWIEAEPEFGSTMLVTSFESFVEEPARTVQAILQHYEIPFDRYQDAQLPRISEYNFRTGRTDEWRQVMSREQQLKSLSLIPARLLARFGWPE